MLRNTAKIMTDEAEIAYRQGYEDAVANYSIWKNGEQVVGCLQTPLKEVLEEFRNLTVPVRY